MAVAQGLSHAVVVVLVGLSAVVVNGHDQRALALPVIVVGIEEDAQPVPIVGTKTSQEEPCGHADLPNTGPNMRFSTNQKANPSPPP